MTRREQAIADLSARGVPLGHSEDVATLKRSILAAGFREFRFSLSRQCLRKVRYSSEDMAHKAARRGGNPEVRPYRCQHCSHWHNGNPPRRLS